MVLGSVVVVFGAVLGAVSTFYVNHALKQGAVRSSAMLSLVVAIICHVLEGFIVNEVILPLPFAFIGGSFIGMVAQKVVGSYYKVIVAALIFAFIYLNNSQFFNGYGGALGASAFIALLCVSGLSEVTPQKTAHRKRFLRWRKFIFKQIRR